MHGLSLIGKSYVVSLLWCKVHVTQGKEFERMNEILLSSSEYNRDLSGVELWLYSQAIVMFVLWMFECNTDIFLVTENG